MKISDSRLRSKVATYLKSEKFQNDFKKTSSYKRIASIPWKLEDIEFEIKQFKKDILKAAVDLTSREYSNTSRLQGADPNSLLLHNITNITRDKSDPQWIVFCRVEIYFNPDWVRAKSLYPKGYPNGVDNLIKLLTNGWDYRSHQFGSTYSNLRYHGRIYGEWHGHKPVYALARRSPSNLLESAIVQYNTRNRKQYNYIYAHLNSEYVSVFGNAEESVWSNLGSRIIGIGQINFGINQ